MLLVVAARDSHWILVAHASLVPSLRGVELLEPSAYCRPGVQVLQAVALLEERPSRPIRACVPAAGAGLSPAPEARSGQHTLHRIGGPEVSVQGHDLGIQGVSVASEVLKYPLPDSFRVLVVRAGHAQLRCRRASQ